MISFADPFNLLILKITSSSNSHAKWLNTLSYLENCGARLIASCEHPTLVKEEMLKHAAEEFRHALHLKKQIKKISAQNFYTYSTNEILGETATLHYLNSLNLKTSRYLKELNFSYAEIKEAAYLLVTYSIELRANEIYSIYNKILKKNKLNVSINSIMLEEKNHLNEMCESLHKLHSGFKHAEHICVIESKLCERWIFSIQKSLENEYVF